MDRRTFIRGAVAVAVAAALPGGNGVALQSIAHPTTNMLITPAALSEASLESMVIEIANSRAKALAHSMMQTREIVARNVLSRAFGDNHA